MATYTITLTNEPSFSAEENQDMKADAYAVLRELSNEADVGITDEQIANAVEVLSLALRGLTVQETALLNVGLEVAFQRFNEDPASVVQAVPVATPEPAETA